MNQKQKDLLCTMLMKRAKTIRDELDGHFCLVGCDEYSIKRTFERNPQVIKTLTPTHQKTFSKLMQRRKKLDAEQTLLSNQFSLFYDEIRQNQKPQRESRDSANTKLSIAVEQAILEIQFAENADQVKLILESLPSAEQLMK